MDIGIEGKKKKKKRKENVQDPPIIAPATLPKAQQKL